MSSQYDILFMASDDRMPDLNVFILDVATIILC